MRKIGLAAIRAYQRLFAWMPPSCRYTPSCSQYTYTAVERFGALHGVVNCAGILVAKRTVGRDGAHDLGAARARLPGRGRGRLWGWGYSGVPWVVSYLPQPPDSPDYGA